MRLTPTYEVDIIMLNVVKEKKCQLVGFYSAPVPDRFRVRFFGEMKA